MGHNKHIPHVPRTTKSMAAEEAEAAPSQSKEEVTSTEKEKSRNEVQSGEKACGSGSKKGEEIQDSRER